MNDASGENVDEHVEALEGETARLQQSMDNDNAHLDPSRWFFASSLFPMIAGTLGPVASAFSICALVRPWRQFYPTGSDIQTAAYVPDPEWLLAINGIQLVVALAANMALLLNMTKRLRFTVAQPITILGWYFSAVVLIILEAAASVHLRVEPWDQYVWSQAFYYGIYASILYFIVASLMVVTFWGAYTGHYDKDFLLTPSQRTLMLQTIMFLMYLLLGALVFSKIEGWNYLDAVYWADVTLFTVGFGDFSAITTLGRALLLPFALVGVISLGLVIGSIRALVLDRGKRRIDARMIEKNRRRIIKRLTKKGNDFLLTPIPKNESQGNSESPGLESGKHLTEFERREKEFKLMRKIQRKAERRRRWVAMATSTGTWIVLWLVGAKVFQISEEPYQHWSYFDGVYLGFVSLTTIGYGDLTPISNPGKSFFVFWSLMALPTMTILISNAGDTVVKGIRDLTDTIGEVTILPGERGFRKGLKEVVRQLTFGRLFEEDIRESPPGFLGDAETRTDEIDGEGEGGGSGGHHFGGLIGGGTDQAELDAEKGGTRKADKERALHKDEEHKERAEGVRRLRENRHRSDDSGSPADGQDNFPSPRRASTMHSSRSAQSKQPQKHHHPEGLGFKRSESIARQDLPNEVPDDKNEYHIILIEEMARVTRHLKAQPPRKYSWPEWAWYLKLIGEDEANSSTHRKARPHRHTKQGGDGQQGKHDRIAEEGGDEAAKQQWSWVGSRNPLMGSQEEAEWILEKLTQKLTQELKDERNARRAAGSKRGSEDGDRRGSKGQEEAIGDDGERGRKVEDRRSEDEDRSSEEHVEAMSDDNKHAGDDDQKNGNIDGD